MTDEIMEKPSAVGAKPRRPRNQAKVPDNGWRDDCLDCQKPEGDDHVLVDLNNLENIIKFLSFALMDLPYVHSTGGQAASLYIHPASTLSGKGSHYVAGQFAPPTISIDRRIAEKYNLTFEAPPRLK